MIVNTTCGRIEGRTHRGRARFLGIPYAADLYPDHAFAPPRPPRPWRGVFAATAAGATVAHPHVSQELFPDPVVAGPCPLNLNVYAPVDGDRPRPVVVWLHGGGFFTGGNASPWYDGDAFARDDVVLVVPNHRLAAEGFMILDDGVANRAVLDITQALRWVHDNIEAFGGDPSDVTVAGQSAGATAALALAGAPGARGLFRRLAVMSAGTPLLAPHGRMLGLSERFAAQLGVPRTRDALTAVPPARRLDLEAAWLPEEVRVRPSDVDERARRVRPETFCWQPTLDGEVVTVAPGDALAVPGAVDALLIGTTVEEWNFLLDPVTPAPSVDACREGFSGLGMTDEDLRGYLRSLETDNPGRALAQALTDRTFRQPAHEVADTAAAAGIPTHVYQFAWSAPGIGAAHCVDLPFAFDHLDAPGAAGLLGPGAPLVLARAVHGALVRFAGGRGPGWTAYDTTERAVMVFDEDAREVPDALRRTPAELRRAAELRRPWPRAASGTGTAG